MQLSRIGAAAIVFALAGCQATNFKYERIGYGPELEMAQADCNIRAMGVQQGYIAYGSPEYLMGAAIGNAMTNASLQANFTKNCMVLHGWRQTPITSTSPAQQQQFQQNGAKLRAAQAKRKADPSFPSVPNRPRV